MSALLAFLIGPVGRWFAVALALLLALGWYTAAQRDIGRKTALDAVRRANDKAGAAADGASRGVLDCPAGKWSRERGRCEP